MNSRKKGRYTKKLRKTQRSIKYSRKYSRKSYNRKKNKKSRRNIKKTRKRSYMGGAPMGTDCATETDIQHYKNINNIIDTSGGFAHGALYEITIPYSHKISDSGIYLIRYKYFQRLLTKLKNTVKPLTSETPKVKAEYKRFKHVLQGLELPKKEDCSERADFINNLFSEILDFLGNLVAIYHDEGQRENNIAPSLIKDILMEHAGGDE